MRHNLAVALVALTVPIGAASAKPLWNAPMSTWLKLAASPHDFTNSNPATTYRWATDRCETCHVPHNPAKAAYGPLWNHAVNTGATFYTMYGTTIAGNKPDATPAIPTLRCLGCHDGVTKVDAYGGGAGTKVMGNFLNPNAVVGTNLTDDHPVSITLPVGTGWTTPTVAKTYSNKVECASCHDPHGVATAGYHFLRQNANICTDCHVK